MTLEDLGRLAIEQSKQRTACAQAYEAFTHSARATYNPERLALRDATRALYAAADELANATIAQGPPSRITSFDAATEAIEWLRTRVDALDTPQTLKFQKVHPDAQLPTQANDGDAGFDLATVETYTLQPGEVHPFDTGLKVAVPTWYELQIRPRSGLALKKIGIQNAPGTIDSGFRGNLKVLLCNHGTEPFPVEKKMRIAQAVFARLAPVIIQEVTELDMNTARGDKGFGSSGV